MLVLSGKYVGVETKEMAATEKYPNPGSVTTVSVANVRKGKPDWIDRVSGFNSRAEALAKKVAGLKEGDAVELRVLAKVNSRGRVAFHFAGE